MVMMGPGRVDVDVRRVFDRRACLLGAVGAGRLVAAAACERALASILAVVVAAAVTMRVSTAERASGSVRSRPSRSRGGGVRLSRGLESCARA